jgi:glycosyltransferase involved in cell wall biosynthesis
VIDADLQHPPELIPRFIARWQEEDTDVVYGQRAARTHRYMKGLFAWIGYRQVPMLYEPDVRFAGASKWDYWKLWNLSIEGITSFIIGPLKVATYVGLVTAILSILYGFYMAIRTIILGNPVPGFPSLLIAILFLGGLQLIFWGSSESISAGHLMK